MQVLLPPRALAQRARSIKLLLLDVDGVLTDGTVVIHASGDESKAFSIRDGAAIVWARRFGLEVGLLSGRPSGATSRRAQELGIRIVSQSGPDKRKAYRALLEAEGLGDHQVAYMGDDVLDLPILARVGIGAAPADAVPEVRDRVHWLSQAPGGRGAVRELIETLLKARNDWEDLVREYMS